MEAAEGPRGRDKRTALDVIMSQIRRKRSATDRKSLGRFLSWNAERATGIPEDTETDSVVAEAAERESERELGWGRVRLFLQRLGKREDSRSLSLAHCDVTATDLMELATLLPFLPGLEEVDLSWNDLIGCSLRAVTSHLQNVGGVRTLRLCSCRLNSDDIAALGESLGCIPLLEFIDLSWNSGVGGGALQSLLGKLPPTLRELHLVACQLTAADATILGGILSCLPSLSVLDLSVNPALTHSVEGSDGLHGFSDFASSLSHVSSLSSLRLQACGLTADSLQALGASLPSLRELDLSCNKSFSGGLNQLTVCLSHLTHLESLDLHLCCLTHTDLDALIQVLPGMTSLSELDLSSNQELGGVAGRLLSALPLSQMRRLPLNSCSLSLEAFTALALAVPSLRCVDVSWCKVVGGRLSLLLDALEPSVLTELRLTSCQLTTQDLLHLASVCKRDFLSSLRVLDLSYNGLVSSEGWAAMFSAGGLISLEEIDLSLRPMTAIPCSDWLPALLCALPRLPALKRVAMQRWTFSGKERQQLSHSLKKRGVMLEADSTNKDGALEFKATNRETAEE